MGSKKLKDINKAARELGKRGGDATLDRYGSEYMRGLAIKRHQVNKTLNSGQTVDK